MVESLKWNDGANILATLQDNSLVVWFYPAVVFVDRVLLGYTQYQRDARCVSYENMLTLSYFSHSKGLQFLVLKIRVENRSS